MALIVVSAADLDAVQFVLAEAAEDSYDQVVCFVGPIDRAADLGHSHPDLEVLEGGEGQAVLVALERPLRFPESTGRSEALAAARCRTTLPSGSPETFENTRDALPESVAVAGADNSSAQVTRLINDHVS